MLAPRHRRRSLSGGGHDAQDFVRAGIPAAMIFVRNDHGSHNPKESMELNDEGLISSHRVYWGWFGVAVLQRDEYRR